MVREVRKNLGRNEKRERILSKYIVENSHKINKKNFKKQEAGKKDPDGGCWRRHPCAPCFLALLSLASGQKAFLELGPSSCISPISSILSSSTMFPFPSFSEDGLSLSNVPTLFHFPVSTAHKEFRTELFANHCYAGFDLCLLEM